MYIMMGNSRGINVSSLNLHNKIRLKTVQNVGIMGGPYRTS
jgi:hypothetical protein